MFYFTVISFFFTFFFLYIHQSLSCTFFESFFFFFPCSFNMIYLGVVYLLCVFLGVLWASWICCLIVIVNFEKLFAIITSYISSALFSLFLYSIYTLCSFFMLSHHSWKLVLGFHSFILFTFQISYSLLPYLQDHRSFLSLIESTDESVEGILHLCYSSFLLLAFHFTAFWDSLHMLVICFTCCVPFPLQTLTCWLYHGHYTFPAWSFEHTFHISVWFWWLLCFLKLCCFSLPIGMLYNFFES